VYNSVKEDVSSIPGFATRCCNEINSISFTEDDLLHVLSKDTVNY